MQGKRNPDLPLGPKFIEDIPLDAVQVPAPPDYLRGRAKEVWHDVVLELVRRNVYDTDTRETMAAYCAQFARFLDAEDDIALRGTIIETTRTIGKGQEKKRITQQEANPSIVISDRACDRMLKLAAELGLTPVARRRVAKISRPAARSPASKWLKNVA